MKLNEADLSLERIKGNGACNFLLLHNAGGNQHFFTHQIELLKKYGDIICLDLPGHGKSKGMPRYQISDFSSMINDVCNHLSLQNICLIGLNNGANIAIDTALTYALPIKNIILIDPPLFMEKEFIAEINAFIDQLEREDHSQFIATLADALFVKTDYRNKEIATHAFNSVDKKALQNIFKGLIEWDAKSIGKLKDIAQPTLCILTDEHHCTYNKLRKEAPHFEIGKVIGSKCWATLEVPEQVNAMIERFLILSEE